MSVLLNIESCLECPYKDESLDRRTQIGDTVKIVARCCKKKGTKILTPGDLNSIPRWCPLKDPYLNPSNDRLSQIKQYWDELPTAYALSISSHTNLKKLKKNVVKKELKKIIKALNEAANKGEFSVEFMDTDVPSVHTQVVLNNFGYKLSGGDDDGVNYLVISWENAEKKKELY